MLQGLFLCQKQFCRRLRCHFVHRVLPSASRQYERAAMARRAYVLGLGGVARRSDPASDPATVPFAEAANVAPCVRAEPCRLSELALVGFRGDGGLWRRVQV